MDRVNRHKQCICPDEWPDSGHHPDCPVIPLQEAAASMLLPAENLELVDHPAHYGGKDDVYEAIKVIRAWRGDEATREFCIGSAIKYLSRAGKKPGEPIERDLAKAGWYIDYAAGLKKPEA